MRGIHPPALLRPLLWALALASIATTGPFAGRARAADGVVSISGVVRDANGDPVAGASVQVASTDGATRARAESGRDGGYRVQLPQGAAPITMRFEDPFWHPQMIDGLSRGGGVGSHAINVTLYRPTGPERFGAVISQILVYKKLYYEDDPQGRDGLRRRYEGRILGIPDPRRAELQGEEQLMAVREMTPIQRLAVCGELDQLLALYGIPCPVAALNLARPTRTVPLGFRWRDVQYEHRSLIRGVEVMGLTAGSPAARAGLDVGDIIVRVNGEITENRGQAWDALRRTGGRFEMTVRRRATGNYEDVLIDLSGGGR